MELLEISPMSTVLDEVVYFDQLTATLDRYGIDPDDVCLINSSVLAAHGLRANCDIDLFLRSAALQQLLVERPELNGTGREPIALTTNIQISRSGYKMLNVDDELFSGFSTIVEGWRIARIEIEFLRKIRVARPIDLRDMSALEEYAYSSPTWDWDLLHSVLKLAPAVLVPSKSAKPTRACRAFKLASKAITELRRSGPSATMKSTVSWWKSGPSANLARALHLEKKSSDLTLGPTRELAIQTSALSVGALLSAQRVHGAFQRYDTLLRSVVFEELIADPSKTPVALEFYNKMQLERVNKITEPQMRALAASVRERGLDPRYPISIAPDGRLADGSHRLACALAVDAENLAVTFSPPRKTPYGRDWFENRGFPEDLIAKLDERLNKAYLDHGVYNIVLVWPPALECLEEIAGMCGGYGTLIDTSTLDLGSGLPSFVREVYAVDDIARWKVEVMLAAMRGAEGTQVGIIVLDLAGQEYRPKNFPPSYLSVTVEGLEEAVCGRVSKRIPGYVGDISIHTGDNQLMNRQMVRALKSRGWIIGDAGSSSTPRAAFSS
jgi:hypothetical protein